MKRILTLACAAAALLALSLNAHAQTPEEVVRQMAEQMKRADTEGFTMDFIIKMPILGELRSHNSISGDLLKSEVLGKDKQGILWSDKTTKWDYDPTREEITITTKEPDKSEGDDNGLKQFNSITDGYDVTLKSETEDAWQFLCKKSRSNPDKDDPARMELTVSKHDYLPLSLKTKKGLITIAIENFTLGVTPESVTFRPEDYPNATIIDKR